MSTAGSDDQLVIRRWLAEEWTQKLGQVVESMTEQRPELLCMAEPHEEISEADEILWYEFVLSAPPGAAIRIGGIKQARMEVGGAALRAVGLNDATDDDASNTYLEILNQATSAVARTISARTSREVSCEPAREPAAPAQTGQGLSDCAVVEMRFGDSPPARLYLVFSAALEAGITPGSAAKYPVEDSELPAHSHTGPPQRASDEPEPAEADGFELTEPMLHGGGDRELTDAVALPVGSKTLDLLMEVELPISISFGRTELLLRDVLKLNSGSIVELSRTISEPVDVVINNCVIARGDVVVVDGNYGVRINQIVSRRERLSTIR
ncbi:MAG: flagellar motor switch protein FliN [Bryobacteraceae bacterium]